MFIKNRFMFFFIIFFETVGCKEIKKKEEKNSFDDLAVLYLNGNKNEALEVAEMILKNGIKSNTGHSNRKNSDKIHTKLIN